MGADDFFSGLDEVSARVINKIAIDKNQKTAQERNSQEKVHNNPNSIINESIPKRVTGDERDPSELRNK
jgi:hypothetical protein